MILPWTITRAYADIFDHTHLSLEVMAPADILLTTIPSILCLEPNGSNLAIFSVRFQEVIEANEKWGHLYGTSSRPALANACKQTNAEKAAMTKWGRSETITCHVRSQRLLDSTAIRLERLLVKMEFSIKKPMC